MPRRRVNGLQAESPGPDDSSLERGELPTFQCSEGKHRRSEGRLGCHQPLGIGQNALRW